MNSTFVKNQVLAYFRFKKKYHHVATEAGRWSADVLASNGKKIVEIETKVTSADLKNDFKKVQKHDLFCNPKKRSAWFKDTIPTYFYFAVPPKLVPLAKKLAKPKGYGVLEVLEAEPYCKEILKPKVLCDKFSEDLHYRILMRQTSELVSLRLKLNKNKALVKLKTLSKLWDFGWKLYVEGRYANKELKQLLDEIRKHT